MVEAIICANKRIPETSIWQGIFSDDAPKALTILSQTARQAVNNTVTSRPSESCTICISREFTTYPRIPSRVPSGSSGFRRHEYYSHCHNWPFMLEASTPASTAGTILFLHTRWSGPKARLPLPNISSVRECCQLPSVPTRKSDHGFGHLTSSLSTRCHTLLVSSYVLRCTPKNFNPTTSRQKERSYWGSNPGSRYSEIDEMSVSKTNVLTTTLYNHS